MLKDVAKKYYLNGYNCAEAMLYAGDEYYQLGLDKSIFKVMAGFGGGVNTEDLCGVVSGSVALLGVLFVEKNAYGSEHIKELTKEFIEAFKKTKGSMNCKELKDQYRDEKEKCSCVVESGAAVLEEIIKGFQKTKETTM
ncbi:C_GCAxxG_C_C family protein [Alkaliphilus metalliredigens QYMF]|uniref:C_GCAxxG_C_C family protein n=1 Tax=Alkaliphilus metalliredigens (strain QYMF) TaxID=293826 RepID=A6TLB9_ALKMQ|nr:C-GCAxxG-C-C family protein [Alkaliphilus metalliredigens]ABR46987.1 C_GCAxxG_C_C family protein [Alkaliphilus metalliredigens QYMF]